MIEQITVSNYILFDRTSVDFPRGMSVITGETGAGKSLLIDAIGYLCGGRIQGDIVRKGSDKAVLKMVLSSSQEANRLLEENGFEPEDLITITRTIAAGGKKSQVRINGELTTLSFLRRLTSTLIDIHSQMDTYQLMDPDVQLDLLDQYAGVNRTAVEQAWKVYADAEKALEEARNETFSDAELEFVTAQLNEIDQADIHSGELEELQDQIRLAERSSKTEEELREIQRLLKRDGGILESVFELGKLIKKNPVLASSAEQVTEYYYQLESISETAEENLDVIRDQARDLDRMQDREFLLKKLYRKYGGSYDSVMEKRAELEQRVDRILHRQDLFDRLEKKRKSALSAFLAESRKISDLRHSVISELQDQIMMHARDLMLENCRFEIRCETITPNRKGTDRIAFLASMNPGQPLTPIQQSASGGELSRLMLALKTVFQTKDGIDTIIFDEIDTGVSGKVALAMGSKMHSLSEKRQVLCITHLASVAVWADTHYRVSKKSDTVMTETHVDLLDEESSVRELAIMAHGHDTDSAVSGMRELREEVRFGKSSVSH